MGFRNQLLALLEKDIWIRKFKREWFVYLTIFLHPILQMALTKVAINVFTDKEDPSEITWAPGAAFFPNLLGRKYVVPEGWRLYFLPNTNYSNTVIMGAFDGKDITPLETQDDLEESRRSDRFSSFAIQFPERSAASNLQYTLLLPSRVVHPDPDERTVPSSLADPLRALKIMSPVFKTHVGYFEQFKACDRNEPIVRTFPIRRTAESPAGVTKYSRRAAIILCVSLLTSIGFIKMIEDFCVKIMADKESRFRELLRMMSMSDAAYWVNAMCMGLSTGLPMCLLSVVLLNASFIGDPIIEFSSASVIFATFLFFVIGNFLLCLFATVISPKARSAIAMSILFNIGGDLLFYLWFGQSSFITPRRRIYFSCFIPKLAFTWCLMVILEYEKIKIGSQWSNLWTPPAGRFNVSLGSLLVAQIISWLAWICIILYIDAVNPWQHGIPRRDAGSPIIRFVRVSKNFGEFKAVDNLSLELYGNQISVLLGPNGAGKTTIMNILTGLFPPDDGDIFINGHSVTRATKQARESIGLCPQHNVLFDYLTVEEHLRFFAKLKGCESASIEDEIDQVLAEIDLGAKRHELSVNLSGGMKRKLCLINAVIGGSKILILDEPSAGLDPEARRAVWTFLQKERRKRTILMTTHYMDEADVLGDRIIFLAKGRLMGAGSPMFLKRILNTGYKLRMAKKSPRVDTAPILSAVKSELGDHRAAQITITSEIGFEVVINIGFPTSKKMVTLFKMLESKKGDLGITHIGVSVTTMDDVFIKAVEIDDAAAKAASRTRSMIGNEKLPPFEPLTGLTRLSRQFRGLLRKRLHLLQREWKLPFFHMSSSVLLTYSVLNSLNNEMTKTEEVKYSMKPLFGNSHGFVAGELDRFSSLVRKAFSEDGVDFSTHVIDPHEDIEMYLQKVHDELGEDYYDKLMVGLSNATLWINSRRHLAGAALARWQSVALTQITGRKSEVDVTLWPLDPKGPRRLYMLFEQRFYMVRFLPMVFLTIVFNGMCSTLMAHPINERQTKFRLIQLMTGVNPVLFHGANFFFDFVTHTIWAALMLCVFLYKDPGGRISSEPDTFYALTALLLSSIVAMIPFSYIMSKLHTDRGTMPKMLKLVVILVSMGGSLIVMLEAACLFRGSRNACSVIDFLTRILSMTPTFSASWATTNILMNAFSKKLHELMPEIPDFCARRKMPSLCQPCKENTSLYCHEYESSFSTDPSYGAGYYIIMQLFLGALFMIVVIYQDYDLRCVQSGQLKSKENPEEETDINQSLGTKTSFSDESQVDDVIREKRVVENIISKCQTALHTLVAYCLTKYFGPLRAVSDVSFHVTGGECFGLLGTNGAGKTTVFGMLTGDITMSEGNAFIKGFGLDASPTDYRRQIGYCTQVDALLDNFTGRETLELLCALRAIPEADSRVFMALLTSMLDFLPLLDRRTEYYSGGNKRRLSIAMALIGNPAMLFLDEPSAGVDPSARKKIFTAIAKAQKEFKTAVVMSSHSMEVCEALCSRVAIMTEGRIRCLGPTQHLKSIYRTGYTVQIKLVEVHQDTVSDLCKSLNNIFGGKCKLKERYLKLFQFHVKGVALKWSDIFEKVQALQDDSKFKFEDVQVSDTTLEGVFLTIAAARTFHPAAIPSSSDISGRQLKSSDTGKSSDVSSVSSQL